MANLNFDATQVEPTSFEPLPAGWYNAIITESEWVQTKDGNGRYLQLKFNIYDGDYKGRVAFGRLNMENANQKAVEIARGQLSAICRAVGVMQPKDSVELHNLPLMIRISCRKNDQTGDIVNDIKDYKPKGSQANPSAVAQANGGTTTVAPWKR